MRFEVPQFIDVEDKIVGPFTWKQFVYLAGGAGASFILYATLPFFVFFILAIPIVMLSAGLAFYQVNNRPLSVFIEAMTTYFSKSRLYLWKKDKPEKATLAPIATAPNFTITGKNNITSLSRKLEVNALTK